MTESNSDHPLKQYADLLETLTPDNLDAMQQLLADDVEFKDPFNHTSGKAGYREVMVDMFANLDDIQFRVKQIDPTPTGGYLIWEFSAYSTITKAIRAEGVSHILIDAEGKITRHYDYWDGSRIMDGMPVIGCIVRWVRKRTSLR
ncbi:nuclear transport factor 2 family protein [Marinobacterium sp. D7]|uniref:nuclear transport factor 2 family protein n=1 Tax=Marinobacterium ramblicola TaxID=2849041 RepID=UPI001C2D68C6|nr:nuclear transport factor 2 family protein [Marinobacterium ramblicola]MBV1788172.1 nuclear transport factor 2 family protein [Marinobacterium ramblicola]